MNDRIEFIGRIEGTDVNDEILERFVYFSQPGGILDLQAMMDFEGSGRQIHEVLNVNDRGTILIHFIDGERSGTIVPTPEAE